MTGKQTDPDNQDLRDATKKAFAIFLERARSVAETIDQGLDQESQQGLHDAYIDYVALRTASRGSWGHNRRRSKFRRFVAARMAVGMILFLPLWLAAVLIIAERI